MFGISCPDTSKCYITGGTSNTGFGIYTVDLANITAPADKKTIDSPIPALMLLSISM